MNLGIKSFDNSKELTMDLVRVYLGLALIGKGIYFMQNMNELFEMTASAISFGDFVIAHYIVFAHVVGGLCIACGLVTRFAVACNIPVLIGAITLVHVEEGFFSATQGLEVALLVFFLLCITLYHGSGKYSVDYLIDKGNATQALQDNILHMQVHRDKKVANQTPIGRTDNKTNEEKENDKAA